MNSDRVDMEILVDYTRGPFFFDARDGSLSNHTVGEAAEFFHLSDNLVRELEAWDREYQDTLNIDVPQDSSFPSERAYQAWLAKGKELAARIKNESPNVGRVGYQARGEYERGECVF